MAWQPAKNEMQAMTSNTARTCAECLERRAVVAVFRMVALAPSPRAFIPTSGRRLLDRSVASSQRMRKMPGVHDEKLQRVSHGGDTSVWSLSLRLPSRDALKRNIGQISSFPAGRVLHRQEIRIDRKST